MADGGSLTVAGAGIRAESHVTAETAVHIRKADKLLLMVPSRPAQQWLQAENPSAESLGRFYDESRDRLETYLDMAEYIVSFVRDGLRVCALAYGHPGVVAVPTHLAVKLARDEGYPAEMLPGISADACLYADLGIDPGRPGCQHFEATDFLVRHRRSDPGSQLILSQIGIVGMFNPQFDFDPVPGLRVLTERLLEDYPPAHPVTVYEASIVAEHGPAIRTGPLEALPSMAVSKISTLYVPPAGPVDPDDAVLDRLGVDPQMRARRRDAERRLNEILSGTQLPR
jgi:uncharacterized protein YabN with tetrapyrrole methylase and pyrophosphatase domain